MIIPVALNSRRGCDDDSITAPAGAKAASDLMMKSSSKHTVVAKAASDLMMKSLSNHTVVAKAASDLMMKSLSKHTVVAEAASDLMMALTSGQSSLKFDHLHSTQ